MVTVGKCLSHYRIVEELGHGGMGVVYRARDEHLPRDVALKVLPAGLFSDETARSRFRREAQTLSQLNHPNIAVVHDFDNANGVDFLAMEFVEGETLAAKVAAGPMPEKEVVALGTQIAEALEEAHEHGIIHRDMKPGNVMVTAKGRAKVLDFGLAKLLKPTQTDAATASLAETQGAAVMGTLPYMSPEQLQGKPADIRTDIYALGAVLYEMATGRRPFPQEQTSPLIAAILTEAPQPPRELNGQVSPGLEAIVLKALKKYPERRYQSAKGLVEDLARLSVPGARVKAQRLMTTRRLALAGVVAASLIGALVIIMGLNAAGLRDRTMSLVGARRGAPLPKIESIAVLPLANLSGDPEQEYFADGMTEELITNLGKISALRVISRTTAMHYKGTKKTLPEIAKELNVDAVIEGSVSREGGQVRITAQLIQATTDQHLWAESYQRELRGVLTLQGEIAGAIADRVRAVVTPTERARLAKPRPVNPEAYEAYLKARHQWGRWTGDGMLKSTEYLRQAMAADPSFAVAYASLAEVYWLRAIGYAPMPAREAYSKARDAAVKALELDDTLSEAHNSLAVVKWFFEWDWAGAEREFNRALELNPGDDNADRWFGLYLMITKGDQEQALWHLKKALELNPLSPDITCMVGWPYMATHQYERYLEYSRKALVLDPDFPMAHHNIGLAYILQGRCEEGIREVQRAMKLGWQDNPASMAVLATGYAKCGQRAKVLKILAEFETRQKREGGQAVWIANIHAILGNKEQAFDWLARAYQAREGLVSLKTEHMWDPLRSDPRFQDLLRRMNFPP